MITGEIDGQAYASNADFNLRVSECVEYDSTCDYMIERTFTATDACDNTSTYTQTITINDNEAPVIDCPEDVDFGVVEEAPTDFAETVPFTDNCLGASETSDYTDSEITIDGGASEPADPYCSGDDEVTVPYTGSDANVRVTFISKIVDEADNLVGYKFRLRNGTDTAVNNVEVRLGGNSPIYTVGTLPAMTEIFFLHDSPIAGVSIFWDGGSKGTASTNENTTLVCGNDSEGETYSFIRTFTANDGCGNTDTCSITYTWTISTATPCESAIAIACGEQVTGSTVGASNDDSLPFCGTDLTAGPGVWYVLSGTGDAFDITADTFGSTFDTKLGVFEGSCDNLVCVSGDDDDSGTLQSKVEFVSTEGVDYYIYVTGFQQEAGDYTLTVECAEPDPVPENDTCDMAIAIACGEQVAGTTAGANSADVENCDVSLNTAPAVWYVLSGTGDVLNITADTFGSDFDTKLGVFSGSCDDLLCVGGNDDASGELQSAVNFQSEAGVDYYILVTGFGNNEGGYILNVSCEELPCEADAGTLTADADEVELVNGEAVISATPNGDINIPVGFESIFVLTTGAELALIDAGATPSFTVNAIGLYTIHTLVYDPNELNPGDLALDGSLTGGDVLALIESNGYCASLDAAGAPIDVVEPGCNITFIQELFCGDTVSGNTDGGDAFEDGIGNWYSFTGTGDEMTVFSTCNTADYDTRIDIFTDCGANLVASNDDGTGCSGFSSELTFMSEVGVVYEVFMRGFNDATGNYELNVACGDQEPCDLPVISELFCGDTVIGDTSDSGTEDVDFNGGTGNWYSFTGNGQDMVIFSTCGTASTNYDTRIDVFTNCGATSVASNDDGVGCPDFTSEVSFFAESGVIYEVFMRGYLDNTGTYELNVACDTQTAPRQAAEEQVKLDFTASPVPFDNEVFISYDFKFDTDVKIEVFDMRGIVIKSFTDTNFRKGQLTKKRINMANAANQVYVVRLTTSKGIVTKNIVRSKIRN